MKKFTVEISGEALRTLQREADYEYLQDYLELQKMIEFVIRIAHQDQKEALRHANIRRHQERRIATLYPEIHELNKGEVIVEEVD